MALVQSNTISGTGYADVAEIYDAMLPSAAVAGTTLANPVFAEQVGHLDDGMRIVDAACGPGYDPIALRRGLPGLFPDRRRHFEVAANDASPAMLARARHNALDRKLGEQYVFLNKGVWIS